MHITKTFITIIVFYGLIIAISAQVTESSTTEGYTFASNPLSLTTTAPFGKWSKNVTIIQNTTDDDVTRNISDPTLKPKTTLPIGLFPESDQKIDCSGMCNNLSASCYNCNSSDSCTYGTKTNFSCTVKSPFLCNGSKTVEKEFLCIYCYLTQAGVEHTCEQGNTTCKVPSNPRQRTKMNCSTKEHVFCLGKRKFSKFAYCNWTSGYKWSTAVILSVTLGGFGADRFYLGHWRSGLGKLFSFGGLGVWTLIDIVLIATTYLGPSDGSLYIL